MNKEALKAFAREAAKGFKTENDLNVCRQKLAKLAIVRAFGAELGGCLGRNKHKSLVRLSGRDTN